MFVEVPDDVGSDDDAHQRFLAEQVALHKVSARVWCSVCVLRASRLQKRLLKNRKRKKPGSALDADGEGGVTAPLFWAGRR